MSPPRVRLLVAVVLVVGCDAAGPPPQRREVRGQALLASAPGDLVKFFNFPKQKSKPDPGTWGPILTEIENHLPSSYGNQYWDNNPAIHAHETTHGINSHIRNTYGKVGDNGFYVLEDRAIVLPEPSMTKSKIAALVPSSLRGSRFSLYITGQTAWDNEPLYVFDEWVAYTNDSAVGVELVKLGKWTYGWTDGVAGTLEFCAYGIATAMAIEQHDSGYFAKTPQFGEFLAWQLKRALELFRAGKDLKEFTYAKQDTYYKELQSGAAAAPLRAFLTQRFGAAFMQQVLGLSGPAPQPDGAVPPPPADGAAPPPGLDASPPPPGQLDGGAPAPAPDAWTPGQEAGADPVIPPRIPPHPAPGAGGETLVGGCALGGRPCAGAPSLLLLALLLLARLSPRPRRASRPSPRAASG